MSPMICCCFFLSKCVPCVVCEWRFLDLLFAVCFFVWRGNVGAPVFFWHITGCVRRSVVSKIKLFTASQVNPIVHLHTYLLPGDLCSLVHFSMLFSRRSRTSASSEVLTHGRSVVASMSRMQTLWQCLPHSFFPATQGKAFSVNQTNASNSLLPGSDCRRMLISLTVHISFFVTIFSSSNTANWVVRKKLNKF